MTKEDSKYRSFFENSADAMLILENDKFVDCNRATVVMLGYDSQDEVINKRPYELSPEYQPDGRLSLEKAAEMIRLANERGNHRFEWDHLRKDGTIIPVEVSLTAIQNQNGVQLHTVWRDISDRKQTEQTLRNSEERFRQVAMTNWVWELDLEGRFTYCSDNVIDTMGYRAEEMVGRTPFDFMPEDEAARARGIFKEHLASCANVVGLECRHVAKDGRVVNLLINGSLYYDATGNLLGFRGGNIDLTDRKRAEEELRASEERYRKLYKETPAMLHSIDAEGRIVSVSNYWLEKLGYQRDEVLNHKSSEFLTEESRRYAQEVVLPEFFRTGYCFDVPYQIVKKNGEILDILLSATTEKDDHGNIVRSLAVLSDVTERKKAVDALAESEEKFRLLLSSTAEAIYGLDTAGQCTFCNPACLDMLGYEDESELLGKSMHKLVHHHKRDGSVYPEKECKIYLAFKKGEGVCDDDEVFWRADGSSFDTEYCSYPMHRGKDVVGAVVTFQDVTERKKVEAALVEAKDFAEEANKVKGEFLAKVSHEIRTPMAVFMSAIDHLLDIDEDPTRRKVLNLADLSSQRLYMLVEEVLDFSKLEDEKMVLEETFFDVRGCLQDAVDMMKVKASEKELGLEVDVAPDVPEKVQGDEFRLGQVLLNLIGNAVKFTEEGRIEIVVKLDNDKLLFIIKDTGVGVPEDKLNTVFDAFSQVDSSTTRKYGGTGLGLSISKGLVELMGGQIHVESQLGHGSQFVFSLPLQSSPKS